MELVVVGRVVVVVGMVVDMDNLLVVEDDRRLMCHLH